MFDALSLESKEVYKSKGICPRELVKTGNILCTYRDRFSAIRRN